MEVKARSSSLVKPLLCFWEDDLKAATDRQQMIAGVGRDAVVLLNSQMAAKALLQTSATEITLGCPKFSLGLSTSES